MLIPAQIPHITQGEVPIVITEDTTILVDITMIPLDMIPSEMLIPTITRRNFHLLIMIHIITILTQSVKVAHRLEQVLVVAQDSVNKRRIFMPELISIIVYSALAIILMVLGNFFIDLIIPCHFPTEIKKKNVAVGYITAGSSISVGIILKAAIMSITVSTATESLLDGVLSTLLYFLIGIVICILGYLLLNLLNQKYDLNNEIGNGNPAAGLMVFGMFIGLAIVISGVIM